MVCMRLEQIWVFAEKGHDRLFDFLHGQPSLSEDEWE